MVVTLFGIVMLVKTVVFWNTRSLIVVSPLGRVTLARRVAP